MRDPFYSPTLPPHQAVSKQSLFDYVAAKLIEQRVPSINVEGKMCMYRGENGCRCAAGWLMPDDANAAHVEGKRILHLDTNGIPIGWHGTREGHENDRIANEALDPRLPRYLTEFVTDLQHCHDAAASDTRKGRDEVDGPILPELWYPLWLDQMLRLAWTERLDASVIKNAMNDLKREEWNARV